MRGVVTVLAVVVMVLVVPADAWAQTCRGLVDISSRSRGIAGTDVAFNSDAASYAGFVGGGSDTLFGGGQVGVVHYDEVGVTSWAIGGIFGGQVAADPERRVMVCPISTVSAEFLDDFLGTGFDARALNIGGGVEVGFTVASTATLSVVPHIGFTVARQRLTVSGFGASESETDTVGFIRLGVGLILNERTSVSPYFGFPVGVDDGEPSFGFAVSFGFARR